MPNKSNSTLATMGIDIGKNSFHVVGLNQRGAIVLRQKWSCGQIEALLANMPSCLIGIARGQHPSPEGGAHNAGGGRQNAGEATVDPNDDYQRYVDGAKRYFSGPITLAKDLMQF